jgi:hypothetical protein
MCVQHIAMKRVIERNKKAEAVQTISPEKRIFFPFIIVQTRYAVSMPPPASTPNP